jgi:hypothetical protein
VTLKMKETKKPSIDDVGAAMGGASETDDLRANGPNDGMSPETVHSSGSVFPGADS